MSPAARRLLVLLVIAGALPVGTAARDAREAFTALRRSGDILEVTFRSLPLTVLRTTIVAGAPHVDFAASGLSTVGPAGEPQIAAEAFSIGVPPGAVARVEAVDQVFESTDGVLVAPEPFAERTPEDEAVAVYRKSAPAYASSAERPGELVRAELPVEVRRQRIAVVRVYPYQVAASAGRVRRLVSATLRIRFVTPAGDPVGAAGGVFTPDPAFEPILRSLLLNYDEARTWRVAPARDAPAADPSRDWFETGRDYYKAGVAADGWYRVTMQDIAAAGGDPRTLDPATVKVFWRGAEVPAVVRADSSVEFRGLRHGGDSSFYDLYTDTSAYWLTWGGVPGRRFAAVPQPSGPPGAAVASAPATVFEERNTAYYRGATQEEVIDNGAVPGEAWIWEFYYPGTTLAHTFLVDTVDRSGGQFTFSARVWGTTSGFPPVSHRARFWLNDSLLGDYAFGQRQGGVVALTFPAAWLRDGANTVTVQSIDTQTFPNQFYLDWFAIDHRRFLRARADLAVFDGPSSSGAGPATFTVAGFSGPSVEVYDLTRGRRITGGVVTGTPAEGYTVSFRDTFATAVRYAVAGPGAARGVPPVVKKRFTDIRANAAGADYLVVTHAAFRAASQQLAAHRQARDGVRTAIVDVQDIYDEFNYGIRNGETLKAFLRHAYTRWPAPAPAYVLLMGDASVDPFRFEGTSVKADYLPAYGRPAGDNWFACFDSTLTFLPSMILGRLPVDDPTQATRLVGKIITYDTYTPGDWNKSVMMITGGTTPGEQAAFNGLTESQIGAYFTPPPLGMSVERVYKTSPAVIDGEHKQRMRDLVARGLVYINFLGHSSGRIWNVDIGNPYELENTNGRLPFVASVSCNVSAFASPAASVLAEDFLLPHDRGAIAVWGSSSLGYASTGTLLVNHMLAGVAADSLRGLGALTTLARYRLWQSGGGPIVIAHINLTPLLGDPLSRLAVPLRPDLAVLPADIRLDRPVLTANDSTVAVTVIVRNFGLVPTDSVGVTVTDLFDGRTAVLAADAKLRPVRHTDSLMLPWEAWQSPGLHSLGAVADPSGRIAEVNEGNNAAAVQHYVYANTVAVVRPLDDMVVPPGAQRLVVTSPAGVDSAGFRYEFELDTTTAFDSPHLVRSGPVPAGAVTGEWTTPAQPEGRICFWRARAAYDSVAGSWVTASFVVSSALPPAGTLRWRQGSRSQFVRNLRAQTAVVDSGVVIRPTAPIQVLTRSLGDRGNDQRDYYSIIRVNDRTISGNWYAIGYGYMAARIDAFSGAFEFRSFNTPVVPGESDSLVRFVENTPAGDYLAIAVIKDGSTNLTEAAKTALEGMGSRYVRQVRPGRSWAMIARAGDPQSAQDGVSDDSVVVTTVIPSYFRAGTGTMTARGVAVAPSWDSFHWRNGTAPGATVARAALLGLREDGRADTLRAFPAESTDVALGDLARLTAGPTYVRLQPAVILTSDDARYSPVLREWWLDFAGAPDPSVSARTVGPPGSPVPRGATVQLPVTVHNTGFVRLDSGRVLLAVYDRYNRVRALASATVDSIPAGASRTVVVPFSTAGFPRRATLRVSVTPSKREKDLVAENNEAVVTIAVEGPAEGDVRFFADGVPLLEGDYVPQQHTLLVRARTEEGVALRGASLRVDGGVPVAPAPGGGDGYRFPLSLGTGVHRLEAVLVTDGAAGEPDSLLAAVQVRVEEELRITDLFNFPNPFAGETAFAFTLTGRTAPERVTIKVFTVAGRLVRTIEAGAADLRVGPNRVPWDGRDQDGDDVANGVYLYQVTAALDGKTESALGKLARAR